MCCVRHCGTITDASEANASPFRLEQIKDDDQAVKFYTGFPTFLHLKIYFDFLGPAAFNLCYGATKNDTPSGGGRSHEFFLTMCRLIIKRTRFELPLPNKPTYSVKNCKHLGYLYVLQI